MAHPQKNSSDYIIYGRNTVKEALATGQDVHSLYVYRGIVDPEISSLDETARARGIAISRVERDVLSKLTGTDKHQGIACRLNSFTTFVLKEILASKKQMDQSIAVVLDSINDPGNLGAIIRSSSAAGVDFLVMNDKRSCPLSSAVFKTSQGGIFHLPVCREVNLARSMEKLKDSGYWVYGFEAGAQKNYFEADFKGKVALVFGSEGKGLRELTEKSCDMLLRIPIKKSINSLNVSVCAALGIFEVLRQRALQNS